MERIDLQALNRYYFMYMEFYGAKDRVTQEERLKIKIFNREICVCALLDTNSLCAKSSAEMRLKWKMFSSWIIR